MHKGTHAILIAAALVAALLLGAGPLQAAPAPGLSEKSKECLACHQAQTPGVYRQWEASRHSRTKVGCYECHAARPGEADAFEHNGSVIAVIVSPKDCSRCHKAETGQFTASHHAKAGRILGSLDNRLAEVVEGNQGLVTPGFPHGNSAAAVSGCWQCHGSEVKVLKDGSLDPATWPNTGIGRLNPDGSEGSCSACHTRHEFSVAQARNPENCGRCHLGPDHPQYEIYTESKHGVAFRANVGKMNLSSKKWVVGQDYSAAPTCATCHMSATPNQKVTHDVGMRISWNNRPELSIRPEASDARLGLPGKDVDWKTRRAHMQDVCTNCHSGPYVENFYVQYDGMVNLYNEKFARPGLALMGLARPLLQPAVFSNPLDFTWFELWHHEGRRARHGAAMMGPDYTHWHGTYEVAKNFYSEFLPELVHLVGQNLSSSEPGRATAAQALKKKLEEVLASPDHRWYLDQVDPEVQKRREQDRLEFQERYKQ